MQSDTVIGIVGAVVLVAVMVGVFAYEYNNAPEPVDDGPDPTTTEGQQELFAAAFPTLNATDDIDMDGTPNFQDDDIDGDGIDNANDTDVRVVIDLTQAAPAHTNPGGTGSYGGGQTLSLGVGYAGVTIEVSHAGGAGGQNRVQVDAGDVGACTTGQEFGCAITNDGSAATGDHTVRVRQEQALVNPNPVQVTITATVLYA